MSVKDISVPGKEFDLSRQPGPLSSVSLNDILEKSMNRARVANAADIIVRCESLPFLNGHEPDFTELFDLLVGLIIKKSNVNATVFLHVNCDEETVTGGLQNIKARYHNIRFHTNFSADEEWKQQNKMQLSRCNEIISNYDGSFMVNNISNTGCLFFISLPINHK
jgi:hypothetical protein